MAKKLYEESSVKAIANAIRGKNGSTDTYKIGDMAAAIDAISGVGAATPLFAAHAIGYLPTIYTGKGTSTVTAPTFTCSAKETE